MTPNQIKRHLRIYLPSLTDLFDNKAEFQLSSLSNILTFTGSNAFSAGQTISVAGGQVRNPITSYVDNGDGSATFTTEFDHDLTEPMRPLDPTMLTLDGIDSAWNDQHVIERVPNRRTFDIANAGGVPDLTNAVLVEDRSGIVGSHTIATANSSSFTVVATGLPVIPDGPQGTVTVSSGTRIYAAANIDRAEQIYTERDAGEFAMFLIMNDLDVSKDRNSLTDALATQSRQNAGRQNIINNFSLVVFIPTDNGDKSGGKAQELAYGDVFKAIVSTMYGFRFENDVDQSEYVTQLAGHGPGVYNTAYYTHVYDFFQPSIITFDEGFNLQPSVAFRDIEATHNILGNDYTSDIDLDDDPL